MLCACGAGPSGGHLTGPGPDDGAGPDPGSDADPGADLEPTEAVAEAGAELRRRRRVGAGLAAARRSAGLYHVDRHHSADGAEPHRLHQPPGHHAHVAQVPGKVGSAGR